MIDQISFKNYKSFKEEQTLVIRPLTILIGKNSTGKSAIAKLPVLIDNSFTNVDGEPFTLECDGVQFGGEYRDLFYGRIPNAELEFKMTSSSGKVLHIKIITGFEKNSIPKIIYWELQGFCILVYNPSSDSYINQITQKIYKISFDGFNPEFDKNTAKEDELFLPLSEFRYLTDYIGPFRVYANEMRFFQLRSHRTITSVDVTGEDAYYLLGVEALQNKSSVLEAVSEWYRKNFDGWGIQVNTDLQPTCTIELTRDDQKFNINIADVGQGMSQALPLVVCAYIPNGRNLTVIEQPELHLHPAAHGNLAELFAMSAVKFNRRYLIETHSQNFVLRIRRLIAEGVFKAEDLQIYWVDYDDETNSSSLKPIGVNNLGEVDFWPQNIFSETLDETLAMRKAQVKKKDGN